MGTPLSRAEISAAVAGLGWRFLLGSLRMHVPVGSLAEAGVLAAHAVAAGGSGLSVDLRADRVVFIVQSPETGWIGRPELDLAQRLSTVVGSLGLAARPDAVQLIEIGIDALDIARVRPFWMAITGYADEPDSTALLDPAGRAPAIWFQQMDAPRPQRNRIHLDIAVPHDQAAARVAAALAAGGELRSDRAAPAFWVLADPEGNEACVTTWQGRD